MWIPFRPVRMHIFKTSVGHSSDVPVSESNLVKFWIIIKLLAPKPQLSTCPLAPVFVSLVAMSCRGVCAVCRVCSIFLFLLFSLVSSLSHSQSLSFVKSSLTQRVGVSRSFSPASLFEHLSVGHAFHPPTPRDTHCVVRALTPPLAAQPPHVCHRQRDWAISIGSRMQQDTGNSQGASTSRRSVSFVCHRSCQKTTI